MALRGKDGNSWGLTHDGKSKPWGDAVICRGVGVWGEEARRQGSFFSKNASSADEGRYGGKTLGDRRESMIRKEKGSL